MKPPVFLPLSAALFCPGCTSPQPTSYRGTPYHDAIYHAGAQKIPGRVQCAYYDLGGEGVAHHDSDLKNNGSGALNPADGTYLNEFRIHEGVDTSIHQVSRHYRQQLPMTWCCRRRDSFTSVGPFPVNGST